MTAFRTFILAIAAAALLSLGASAQEKPAEAPRAEVFGTIVSIRGNILHIRPSLRPKLTRVSFGDKTEIVGNRRTTRAFLKPGMRVALGGPYNEKDGLRPFWIEAAPTAIGQLKDKFVGIARDGGWGRTGGKLESVEPLVVVDDAGEKRTFPGDKLRGFWEDYQGDRNTLLIGTRLFAVGTLAPDGVMEAVTISPERDHSAAGMMFGQIVSVGKGTLTVRPRYTHDTIQVTLPAQRTMQREIRIDADTIKTGDTVTFWGQRRPLRPGDPPSSDLKALALLLGPGRYPTASEGDEAGVFATGRIVSLDPVRLQTTGGETLNIIVPAQMSIARLIPVADKDLRPGAQVMLVLSRAQGDTFEARHVILDASPWVGYGG